MYPEKVPDAAALLDEYGSAFGKMEEEAAIAVKNIQEVVEALR
jgi:hypothetical protein